MRRQDQQRQQRLPCSSRAPALLLALAALLRSASGVPLSDWHDGIATNYGGAQDGMNPYDPSFGTKEVSTGLCAGIAACCPHQAGVKTQHAC